MEFPLKRQLRYSLILSLEFLKMKDIPRVSGEKLSLATQTSEI